MKVLALLLVISVSVVLLPACVVAAPWQYIPDMTRDYPNLLYNPSFEQEHWFSGADHAEFWGKNSSMERVSDRARTGDHAYRLFGPSNGYTSVQGQDGMTLIPGEEYTFSCYYWIDETTTGPGAHFRLYQIHPSTELRLMTDPLHEATGGWQYYEATFSVGSGYEDGYLRIYLELAGGDEIWIDDVALEPTSGNVPTAPAPMITPDASITAGPQYVTLSSTLDHADIRYTINTRDPHPFSTKYQRPFWQPGSALVKARTFRTGYRTSAVTALQVNVNPQYENGRVPFYPVGYGMDVDDWWAGHPYNPESPDYVPVGEVTSNTTQVIHVADVWDANPASETAGIQEALAMLDPQAGGTLYFEKARGPYTITRANVYIENYEKDTSNHVYYDIHGSVEIFDQSNVHFIGSEPGTVIRAESPRPTSDPRMVANIMFAMESFDHGALGFGNPQIPERNFYFKNLTFDGGYDDDGDGLGYNDGDPDDDDNHAGGSFIIRHCADILFDSCDFVNFYPAYLESTHWHGSYGSAVKSDNQWVRDCSFDSLAGSGWYVDGIHNGGVLDCEFTDMGRSAVTWFTNNDVVRWCAEERNCQFMVFRGNTVYGHSYGYSAIYLGSVSNTIIEDNVIYGPCRNFVEQIGRGESNIMPYVRYSSNALRIRENQVSDANQLLYINRDVAQFSPIIVGAVELTSNTANDIQTLVELVPIAEVVVEPGSVINEDARIDNVRITGNWLNEASGADTPLVRFPPEQADHITSVVISGNYFGGTIRETLVDNYQSPYYGGRDILPARCEGITLKNNRPVPPAPTNPQIIDATGQPWVFSWTDNAAQAWFYRVYAWPDGAAGEDAFTTAPVAVGAPPDTAQWAVDFIPVPGQTWNFQAAACYPFFGESARSETVQAVIPVLDPACSINWRLYP